MKPNGTQWRPLNLMISKPIKHQDAKVQKWDGTRTGKLLLSLLLLNNDHVENDDGMDLKYYRQLFPTYDSR